MAAKAFFDELGDSIEPDKIKDVTQSYLFEIAGEGSWLVDVHEGRLRVTEGYSGDADVTISTSSTVFDAMTEGTQNPMTAYMTGKIKVKGDLGAAMKLKKLF